MTLAEREPNGRARRVTGMVGVVAGVEVGVIEIEGLAGGLLPPPPPPPPPPPLPPLVPPPPELAVVKVRSDEVAVLLEPSVDMTM